MENTDAEQQPTPEQAAIIERLRLMQAEVDAVKTDLVAKLQESREQVDSLFRELSKVRDELITSKTERRVLSRWYEDAKGERDKIHGELVEVRSALAAVSDERDSLRTTLAAWEAADTAPFVKMPDVADHVMPPVFADAPAPTIAPSKQVMPECHGCGKKVKELGRWCGHEGCDYINGYDDDQERQAWDLMHPVRPKE